MAEPSEEEHLGNVIECKVVLLGDSGVGKTSIVKQYVTGAVNDFELSTIGAAFSTKTEIINGKPIKFNIWDTAGQEKFRTLAPLYYREAQAAIVVYDITKKDTLSTAKGWVTELQLQIPDESVKIVIIGNKIDLDNQREVNREQAIQYVEEKGFSHFEVSAKTGSAVHSIFKEIGAIMKPKPRAKTILLNDNRSIRKKKKGCC